MVWSSGRRGDMTWCRSVFLERGLAVMAMVVIRSAVISSSGFYCGVAWCCVMWGGDIVRRDVVQCCIRCGFFEL